MMTLKSSLGLAYKPLTTRTSTALPRITTFHGQTRYNSTTPHLTSREQALLELYGDDWKSRAPLNSDDRKSIRKAEERRERFQAKLAEGLEPLGMQQSEEEYRALANKFKEIYLNRSGARETMMARQMGNAAKKRAKLKTHFFRKVANYVGARD